ncbi:MAG: STAS domain-containing protein [Streptosporangiaceae bacterium]
MFSDTYPLRWVGLQAVIALPEHIDVSNAGQIREELLSVINRGAVVLIADMTATVSCDQAGADAVLRAHRRAVVSGTQLRLAVTAGVVMRVLGLSGLDRLVSIYPSPEAAMSRGMPAAAPAVAARPARTDGQAPPRPAPRRRPGDTGQDLPDMIINTLFRVGLSLQAAMDQPRDTARERIAEVLQYLDDIIRDIRDAEFGIRGQPTPRGRAGAPADPVPRQAGAEDQEQRAYTRHVLK